LIHSGVVHAVVDDTYSFLIEMYHKYLGFREFVKYGEWGKFAASVGHSKLKSFSFRGLRLQTFAPPRQPLTKSSPGQLVQSTRPKVNSLELVRVKVRLTVSVRVRVKTKR